MSPTITQSVLVYDRISQNRRTTILLVAIVVLAVVPFVGLLSYVGAEIALGPFVQQPENTADFHAQFDLLRKELETQAGSMRTEYDVAIERQMQAGFDKMQERNEDNRKLKWKFTLIFALA